MMTNDEYCKTKQNKTVSGIEGVGSVYRTVYLLRVGFRYVLVCIFGVNSHFPEIGLGVSHLSATRETHP